MEFTISRVRGNDRNNKPCDGAYLKPCPFCGCDDCRVQVETYGKWARVFCPLCGASTMSVQVGYNDPALAVKLWNERADDRIAELEGKIDQLTAHSDIERQDDKRIPEVQE